MMTKTAFLKIISLTKERMKMQIFISLKMGRLSPPLIHRRSSFLHRTKMPLRQLQVNLEVPPGQPDDLETL
jgi:hypothetical protein